MTYDNSNASILDDHELHALNEAAWMIFQTIAYDCYESISEAENADPEEIVELAFDAGRLEEYDRVLYSNWRVLLDFCTYREALRAVAQAH